MEEDIKILERMKNEKFSDMVDQNGKKIFKLEEYKRQAIENLIARNKELEEENKSQQTHIKVLNEKVETFRKENIEHIIQNRQYELHYIPKSKVKEKIEELKNGTYDAKIILQKLLEDFEDTGNHIPRID